MAHYGDGFVIPPSKEERGRLSAHGPESPYDRFRQSGLTEDCRLDIA